MFRLMIDQEAFDIANAPADTASPPPAADVSDGEVQSPPQETTNTKVCSVPFSFHTELDSFSKQLCCFQSITSWKSPSGLSFEELRVLNYASSKKYAPSHLVHLEPDTLAEQMQYCHAITFHTPFPEFEF